MAVVIYTCDTCKREIEIPQNKYGVEVIGHCIITNNCNGSLKQQSIKPAYIRGKLPAPDSTGLEDWAPRRVFFNYKQTIAAKKWIVPHNLDTNPSVQVYVYTVDGFLVEATPAVRNYTLTYVSPFELMVEFRDPTTGVVQCIARSTAASDMVAPTSVKTAQFNTAITGGGVLTIATLSDVADMTLDIQFISPLFFTPSVKITATFSTVPSFLSPWKNAHKLFFNGKLYTVRTAIVATDIFNNKVAAASPFYFSAASFGGGSPITIGGYDTGNVKVGDVVVLLANEPYDEIDRKPQQILDIVDITATNAASASSQLNDSLYVADNMLRSIYPLIKVVD